MITWDSKIKMRLITVIKTQSNIMVLVVWFQELLNFHFEVTISWVLEYFRVTSRLKGKRCGL